MLTSIRESWVEFHKHQAQDNVCVWVSSVASVINTDLLILWVKSLGCWRGVRDAENTWLY